MRSRAEVWLSRAATWVLPLLFLAVNAGLFAFSRMVLATRASSLEARYEEVAHRAAGLGGREKELGERLEAVRANRERREQLFRDWFSTPEERLTASIAEVKELAARSGLQIRAIAYPQETIADYGLARRSFRFSVEGSYAELRQLAYLIEMTPSFLVLEKIEVGEVRAGADLRADLELSTLFAAKKAAVPATPRSGS